MPDIQTVAHGHGGGIIVRGPDNDCSPHGGAVAINRVMPGRPLLGGKNRAGTRIGLHSYVIAGRGSFGYLLPAICLPPLATIFSFGSGCLLMNRTVRSLGLIALPAILLTAALPLARRTAPSVVGRDSLDLAGMDRTVKPGDNFFLYANGTWIKNTPIPADRATYGAGEILSEITDKRVADLIQEAAKSKAAPGSDLQKVGDYYGSIMDSAGIEAAGIKPLAPALAR